jgi:transcriptional regulator with XRE-family HTH domain
MNNPGRQGTPTTLGARIAECRESRGWTQKKLAEQAGISVTFVSEVENDRRMPGSEILLRIANALGVSIDYLLTGRSFASPPPRPVVVPPELARAAEDHRWPFAVVQDLLKAHQLVIARRSRDGVVERSEDLSKQDWYKFYGRWFGYEDHA